MKILLRGGTVVNVFADSLDRADVLIEDGRIIGVGDYADELVDRVDDVSGRYICPGFIDGHIHIESTMMTPYELARMALPHGTTAVVADPHEIANVCGADGIRYMMEASRDLPLTVYFTIPSCVPATPFDESGAVMNAEDIKPFYRNDRVVGLAEMMNYPGVINGDEQVMAKIRDALAMGKRVDGHAPLICGAALEKYVAAGISSDHECSEIGEALEKLKLGQWIMIRQGTAARNEETLLPLFNEPYNRRCLLVTDDLHPVDMMGEGHIDNMIRIAARNGKSVIAAIRMASIQAAEYFGIRGVGAVAPGYRADLLVLENLNTVAVKDVYSRGERVVCDRMLREFPKPKISKRIKERVQSSFRVEKLTQDSFYIEPRGKRCRVIEVMAGQLLTFEQISDIDWSCGGISTERDILKIAVIERHLGTGHIGLGFINGLGIKCGAIASSVSHDSHNIIVVGASDGDMAVAANFVCENGGHAVVKDGEIVAAMPLPIAGLMTEATGEEIAEANDRLRTAVKSLGTASDIEPFMNMAFLSLPVIPSLKMTPGGLVDVDAQERVSLYFD